VVIVAAGGGYYDRIRGDSVIAFALPGKNPPAVADDSRSIRFGHGVISVSVLPGELLAGLGHYIDEGFQGKHAAD
jgi:hypothetical protein